MECRCCHQPGRDLPTPPHYLPVLELGRAPLCRQEEDNIVAQEHSSLLRSVRILRLDIIHCWRIHSVGIFCLIHGPCWPWKATSKHPFYLPDRQDSERAIPLTRVALTLRMPGRPQGEEEKVLIGHMTQRPLSHPPIWNRKILHPIRAGGLKAEAKKNQRLGNVSSQKRV